MPLPFYSGAWAEMRPTARRLSRFRRAGGELGGHEMGVPRALLVIALWLVSGPYFHYSDTWQLIINTGTVVSFLLVFPIQNTRNCDARAIHLELHEIIKSIDQA
jgi:low affinity Fe/Cu permease